MADNPIKLPKWILSIIGTVSVGVMSILYNDHLEVQALGSRCSRLNEELEDLEDSYRKEREILNQISKAVTRLEVTIENRVK